MQNKLAHFFDTINIATDGKYTIEEQREILVKKYNDREFMHDKSLFYNALSIINKEYSKKALAVFLKNELTN